MSVSQLKADVIYSLENSSVISASNLSNPRPQFINASEFLSTFYGIFGPDNTSTIILGTSTTCNQLQWQLASALSSASSPPIVRRNYFAGILTIPLLFFQRNFFNQNIFSPNNSAPVQGLPDELYAFVDLSEAVVVGVIPHWTVIVYTTLSSAIFILCIIGICLASLVHGPAISSFPLVDFVSRILTNRENSLANILVKLREGKDDDVQLLLADKGLILKYFDTGPKTGGRSRGDEKNIGFTMKS
jgi:hypothetical protein